MEDRVEGLIQQLQETSAMPVAVGFGVSGPKQVLHQFPAASHSLSSRCIYKWHQAAVTLSYALINMNDSCC